jgi:hypothetical protein
MRGPIEISWILEGQSPDTISMARLGEYMQQLAVLFGEQDGVHFARIEPGSLKLVARMRAGEVVRRVQSRVSAVRERRAPAIAMSAYHKVNEMVGEDRGSARVSFGAANVLRFPGRPIALPEIVSLVDHATITGRLYALMEDQSGQLKARIRPREGDGYIACTVDNRIASNIGKHFQEAVRAQGRGQWVRSAEGYWSCKLLHITKIEAVADVSLRAAIEKLRGLEIAWPDDPFGDWDTPAQDGAA